MKKNGISKAHCESAKPTGRPSEDLRIPKPMDKVKIVGPRALEQMASGTKKKAK